VAGDDGGGHVLEDGQALVEMIEKMAEGGLEGKQEEGRVNIYL
jgi:hypothetical protein